MNIKSSRLPASRGAQGTADHVLRGKANERIVLMRGSEQALHDMVADARIWRRRFAIRHFKVSPKEAPTPSQVHEAIGLLAEEFGFAVEDAVIVCHVKRRRGGAACPFHFHVLVPEVDPSTGRVLSSRWSYARQEKVSRLVEAHWGHAVIQGRFNGAVLKTLHREGRDGDADLLVANGLDPELRARSQYPDGLAQEVARKTGRKPPPVALADGLVTDAAEKAGRGMPDIAQHVRGARFVSDGPAAFAACLAERRLRVVPGRKKDRWAVEAQGLEGGWAFAGSLDRLLKVGVHEADGFMRNQVPHPAGRRKGEEQEHGYGHGEQDGRPLGEAEGAPGEELGAARVRRAARGHARPRHAPAGGRPGDDADHRGGPGHRQHGAPADEPAGRAWRDGGGERARPRRGAAGGEPGGAEGQQPEAGRHPAGAGPIPFKGDGHSARAGTGPAPGGAGRRLRLLLQAAALEQRFREERQAAWLDGAMRDTIRPRLRPLDGGSNRTLRCADADDECRERHARFCAMLLRRAYCLADHLPLGAVLNLARVDVDPKGWFVMLTLRSGTQLLDTGDRITVRGNVADVAVSELVACVERRGWGAVVLTGDDEFRMAASRELLRRGIAVVDCPLDEDEQATLRAEAKGPGLDWSTTDTATAHVPSLPWSP